MDGYLTETEAQAQTLFLRLVKQYATEEVVAKALKVGDLQTWERKTNGIRNRAGEVVMREIAYE